MSLREGKDTELSTLGEAMCKKILDIYVKSAYIIQPSITARPIYGGSPLLGVSINTSQGPGDWTTSGEKT